MKVRLLSCNFLCIIFLFFSLSAFAEVNLNYKIQYRSVPSALNGLASLAYENLLWGRPDKAMPFYGYYKVGVVAGGSPTLGAFLEVAPIAPLVLKYQKSMTYRFLKSSVFNCETVYCFGSVERNDFSIQLAAGSGKLVAVSSYLWRDLRVPESSNPVLAEQELFTAMSGTHSYNELGLTIGYVLDDASIFGVHYTAGFISQGSRRSAAIYGIYHWKWNDFDLTAGAGRYETDQASVSGSGILFVIGKKFGETLSLF